MKTKLEERTVEDAWDVINHLVAFKSYKTRERLLNKLVALHTKNIAYNVSLGTKP